MCFQIFLLTKLIMYVYQVRRNIRSTQEGICKIFIEVNRVPREMSRLKAQSPAKYVTFSLWGPSESRECMEKWLVYFPCEYDPYEF